MSKDIENRLRARYASDDHNDSFIHMDSLELVEVLLDTEEEYGVTFEQNDIKTIIGNPTVEELASIIETRSNKNA